MAKKTFIFAVKLCVTVGLFVLLFRPQTFGLKPDAFGGVTPQSMLAELRQSETHSIVFWMGFACIVKMLGLLCGMVRWNLLLRGQGIRIPFAYLAQSWFIGRMIGVFLPGTIGLDGYRLYDSSLYTGEVIKCTSVIAVEKLIGFVALTFLVFITFPLGFALLKINAAVLAVILTVLAGFVAVSFITLLNPRVIQVLVAALPTPRAIRNKVDKLGVAITAYSGNRSMLLLAVVFGLGVHLATCFMYFGTMMAIRAENTHLRDILFASPLMIYGTVIGPSVGGEGIREIVFVTLLSAKTKAAAAATLAHLGWWVGEFVPFLVGVPIFVLRKRASKEEIQAKLREAREREAAQPIVHLKPEQVAQYQSHIYNYIIAGFAGGVSAGCAAGLAEAAWLISHAANLKESVAYWWGPMVYGLCFIGVGLGIVGGLMFIALVLDRFLKAQTVFGLSLGGSVAAAVLVIGGFRYFQDVKFEHMLSAGEMIKLAVAAGVIGLVACEAGLLCVALVRSSRRTAVAATVAGYLLIIVLGFSLSAMAKTAAKAIDFTPTPGVSGPNIILIAVDTLRADYLKSYEPNAAANTPAIDALRKDAVQFDDCFAQSSWTKASFATIFTGKYPETHGAYEKSAILSSDNETFPEILKTHGYYTQGFCNNPNIADTYNYGQGFVEYDYLRPRYVLFANQSAEKMVLYKVVRQVWSKVVGKLTGGRINVQDFYQPANVVTDTGLGWLDSGQRPKDSPFFLFLHYMDPHDPYIDHNSSGVGYARVRLGVDMDPAQWKDKLQKAYVGEIEYCDKYIGQLIDGLKQRGLYDNSLIVFTADHGEEFHEHGGWWHGLSLYDEQIGIPLMFKLPQNQLAGQECTYLARHVDLGPTLLQFANADPKEATDAKMQGKSLFASANAPSPADVTGGFIYSHLNFEGIELRAVRTPLYKLIHSNENKRHYAPVELYNVGTDPGEQKNLAATGDAQELELGNLLDGMQKYAAQNAQAPVYAISADQQQALEALGYGK